LSETFQQERTADIVRALVRDEIPRRSFYGLIALNLALFFVVVYVILNVYQTQREQERQAFERTETQNVWNANLKGQIEGLKATVEFGPRISALEDVQRQQLAIIAAIANKLGIREVPDGRSSEREADTQ